MRRFRLSLGRGLEVSIKKIRARPDSTALWDCAAYADFFRAAVAALLAFSLASAVTGSSSCSALGTDDGDVDATVTSSNSVRRLGGTGRAARL